MRTPVSMEDEIESAEKHEEQPPPDETVELHTVDKEDNIGVPSLEKTLVYKIDETPPWIQTVIMALQHIGTSIVGSITMPIIMAGPMCFDQNDLTQLIATNLFVLGIATILQILFGIRLPIIQGPSAGFLVPTLSILFVRGSCPAVTPGNATNEENELFKQEGRKRMNEISVTNPVTTSHYSVVLHQTALYSEVRNSHKVSGAILVASLIQCIVGFTKLAGVIARHIGPIPIAVVIANVSGAILVSSIIQCIVGFTGLAGVIAKYIGPIPIAITIANVGISIFPILTSICQQHWGISILGVFLVTLFSQFFANWRLPCRGGRQIQNIFTFFPILLAIVILWIVCAIFTATGVFPDDPDAYGYAARTDINIHVVGDTPWFSVPYPGQWGLPTFAFSGIAGMLTGTLAGMLQSLADYYSCSLVCSVPPPPQHAINRGVGVEGVTCLIAAIFGTGLGLTSYPGNIAAISLTKVASRVVLMCTAIGFIVLGLCPKFSAIVSIIPQPAIISTSAVVIAMVCAMGLASLRTVPMSNPRNLFIVGLSLYIGIELPLYTTANPDAIQTGSQTFDDIIKVIFTNGMFLGGFTALVFDLLIKGTPEERGLTGIQYSRDRDTEETTSTIYDLPFGLSNWISGIAWMRKLPFSPNYKRIPVK